MGNSGGEGGGSARPNLDNCADSKAKMGHKNIQILRNRWSKIPQSYQHWVKILIRHSTNRDGVKWGWGGITKIDKSSKIGTKTAEHTCTGQYTNIGSKDDNIFRH